MANLQATLENAVKDEPEIDEDLEFDEGEPAEVDESVEEPAEETEEELEDEESVEDQVYELPAEAKFQIGDELLTGQELKDGYLRRADYSKKTAQLAEERKSALERAEKAEEDREDLIEFVKSFQDVDVLEAELEALCPESMAKLRARWIEEEIELQDLDEGVAKVHRENRKHRLSAKQKANAEAESRRIADRKKHREMVAETKRNFTAWSQNAAKAVGLNLEEADHVQLLGEKIAFLTARGVTVDEKTFHAAAKEVARVLGIKAAPAPEPGKTAKPKPKLPPVKDTGVRGPKGEKPGPSKRKHVDTSSFFAEIKKRHGL